MRQRQKPFKDHLRDYLRSLCSDPEDEEQFTSAVGQFADEYRIYPQTVRAIIVFGIVRLPDYARGRIAEDLGYDFALERLTCAEDIAEQVLKARHGGMLHPKAKGHTIRSMTDVMMQELFDLVGRRPLTSLTGLEERVLSSVKGGVYVPSLPILVLLLLAADRIFKAKDAGVIETLDRIEPVDPVNARTVTFATIGLREFDPHAWLDTAPLDELPESLRRIYQDGELQPDVVGEALRWRYDTQPHLVYPARVSERTGVHSETLRNILARGTTPGYMIARSVVKGWPELFGLPSEPNAAPMKSSTPPPPPASESKLKVPETGRMEIPPPAPSRPRVEAPVLQEWTRERIGERLRELAKTIGLTHNQLAAETDISRSTLYHIMVEGSVPTFETAQRLLAAVPQYFPGCTAVESGAPQRSVAEDKRRAREGSVARTQDFPLDDHIDMVASAFHLVRDTAERLGRDLSREEKIRLADVIGRAILDNGITEEDFRVAQFGDGPADAKLFKQMGLGGLFGR